MRRYDTPYEKNKRTKLYKLRDAARHRARYAAEKKYGKAALKGKQVDHQRTNPGGDLSNDWSNLTIVDASYNLSKKPPKSKKRNY